MEICGETNVSAHELDLIAYSSDLASLPPLIQQMYKIKPPQFIIRPLNTEQISKIIKIALKNKIPFTSKAGSSSGTGASIPIDGGIVFDMTRMNQIVEINPNYNQVIVQPGITWESLNLSLNKFGLMTGTHPSSSPSATVGGFISTGGYAGIGAPKFGSIAQSVQKLKLVLPNGEISYVYPPLTSLFIGAEGTLGIITEITLQVYPKSQLIKPLIFSFKDIDSAISLLNSILQLDIIPYYSILLDRNFLETTNSLGLNLPKTEFLLLITLEGTEVSVQADLDKIRSKFPQLEEIDSEIALEEWERRFKSELFIKRAGPSLILVEIGISLNNIPELYKIFKEMEEKEQIELGICGILGHGASMLCMPFILTDERDGLNYLKSLSFSRQLISKAIKYEGGIYGIGLWGSSYLPFIHDQEKLKIFEKIKFIFDEYNLSNPGKIVNDRTPERMRPPKPN